MLGEKIYKHKKIMYSKIQWKIWGYIRFTCCNAGIQSGTETGSNILNVQILHQDFTWQHMINSQLFDPSWEHAV